MIYVITAKGSSINSEVNFKGARMKKLVQIMSDGHKNGMANRKRLLLNILLPCMYAWLNFTQIQHPDTIVRKISIK